ncbi:MAG: BMP family protein [Chloroflexota bacterium]
MTARQRRRLLALLAGLSIVLVVLSVSRGTPTVAQQPTARPTSTPRSAVPDPVPRIAIAQDADGRDAGVNSQARNGARRVADAFEAEFVEVTADPDDTDAELEQRLTALAEARSGLVFVIGSAYAGPLATVAPKYPGTWFAIVDDGSVNAPNVVGILFNEEQGSFLVGAAAALTSKTGTVAFIGAAEAPRRQRYEAGFTAGARAADPDVTVQVRYLPASTDDDADGDVVQARDAALRLYDAGADVIYAAAGDASDGVFQAAHDRGLWAIGADLDRYQTADPGVRDAILTSMLKRIDVATYAIGMEVTHHVGKDGNNLFGVGRDGVAYSPSGGFVDAIRPQLDAFAAGIASGEILVPIKP